MAKLMINKNKKKVPLHRRSTGIFRNIWADASMKDSMWVKTLKSRMLMGCVQMWWKHSKRLRFRYCAGRGMFCGRVSLERRNRTEREPEEND